jgi:hypothetical protein
MVSRKDTRDGCGKQNFCEKVSRSFSRTNSDDGKASHSFLRSRFRKKIQSCIVF